MSLTLVTPPAAEPVSLTEAKAHLRVVDDADDTYIATLIEVARRQLDGAAGWLSRALVYQEWDQSLDSFPPLDGPIFLGLAPVRSVTSITYIDENGATQTFSASKYAVGADLDRRPRVDLAYGECWPTPRWERDAVTVRFVAGYTGGDSPIDTSAVPAPLRQAMLLMIGDMYNMREPTVVGSSVVRTNAVDALVAPYERPWPVAQPDRPPARRGPPAAYWGG